MSAAQRQLELDRVLDLAAGTLESPAPCSGRASLRCRQCARTWEIQFVCPRRCAHCPWLRTRRLASTLGLLPRVPLRHWVFSLPKPWRARLAERPALLRRAIATFTAEVFAVLRRSLGTRRIAPADARLHCGAATVVHRTDAALGPHLHLHALVLDGAYAVGPPAAAPIFYPLLAEPNTADLRRLTSRLHKRLRSLIAADARESPMSARGELQQRLVKGPAVHPSPRRLQLACGRPARNAPQGTIAMRGGLRVHVGAQVGPEDRPAVIRLVRYIHRPTLDAAAFESPAHNTVRYRLEHPFADGTTHVEFSTRALAARLEHLTPPACSPRVAYHGILAPRAARRWRVIPAQLELAAIALASARVDLDEPAPRTRQPSSTRASPAAALGVGPCRACGGQLELVGVEEFCRPLPNKERAA